MTEFIQDKNEIDKIIQENIKGRRIIFTKYYYLRLAEKGLEHKKFLEIFGQFDKVFAVEKEILKFGDIGYELFYRISENIVFSIAICNKKNIVEVIHANEYNRNLGRRFMR